MQYTILKTRYCLRAFLLVAILACLPGRASASIDECHVSIYFDSEWHEYVENTDVELEPGYYRVRIGRGPYGKSMFNVKYTVDFGDMYANENDTIPETGELEFEIHTGGSVGISWEYYDADGYSDIAGLYVKLVPTPHDEPVVYIEGLSYYGSIYTKELTDGYSSRTVTWSAQASAGCPGHAYCTVSPSSGTITNGGKINVTDKGGGFGTSTTTVSVYIKQGKPNLALSGSQIKIWYNQPSSDNVYIYYKWSNQSSWTSKLVTGSSAFYISTVDNATISAHVKSTINNYQKDSDNATFTMKSSPTITTSGEPDEDGAGATVTATIRNPNTTGRIKYGYKNLYTNTTFGDYTTSSSSVAVSCSYPYRIWATIVDDRGNAISQTKDYWTLYKLAYPKINGSTASSIMFNEGESFTVSNVATHLGDNAHYYVRGYYKRDNNFDFDSDNLDWEKELGNGEWDDGYGGGDHFNFGNEAQKSYTAKPGDYKTEIESLCSQAGWDCIPNCDDNSHIYWIRVRLKAPTITLNRTGETVTANTKLREGDSYVVHQNTDHSGYYEAKRFNVSGVNDHTFEAPFYNKTASYTIEEGGNNRWEFRSIDTYDNDYSYETSDAATINCRYSNVECKEPTASGPSNKYTEGDKITVSCNSAHAARTEYFWETRYAQPASEYQYSTVPSDGLVTVMPGTIIMRNIGTDGYQTNFGTPKKSTYQVMMKTPTSNVDVNHIYTEGDMLTVYSNTQAHALGRGNYYLRAHFNEQNGPTSYQVLSQNASSLQIQVRPLELSARNIAYTDDFWDSDHTTSGNAYGFYPSNWYDSGGWGDQLKVRMKAPTFYVHGTSTPVTSGMDYDFFEGDVLDVKGNTSITGTGRVLRMLRGSQNSWTGYGDPQPNTINTVAVVPDFLAAFNEPRDANGGIMKTTDHYLASSMTRIDNLNVSLKQPTFSATPTGMEYTSVSNLQITEGRNAAITVHRKSSEQTTTYFKWSDQINYSSTTASTFKIQPRRGVTLSAYAPTKSFASEHGTFAWKASSTSQCDIMMKCATPNAMPSRTLLYNDRIELAPSYEASAATLAWGWDGAAMTSAGSRGSQSLPARLGTLRVKTAKEGYADSDTCTVRYDTFRDRGGVEYQLDAEGEFRVTGANPLTLAAITIPTATAMHDGGREYRVRSIAAGAFTLMDNLAVVAIDNPVPPALDADAFTLAQYDSVRLEVPETLHDVYAAAPVWERFFRQADNLGAGAAGKPYYVKDGTVVFLRRCQSARITQADGRTIYNGPAEAGSRIRLPFGTPVIVNADGQTEKHFTK